MSETYINLFLNSLSIIAIIMMMLISLSKRRVKGGMQFAILSSFLCIWAIGSFMETIFSDLPSLLLWRNITQIGVFLTPVSYLYFTITYTDSMNKNARRILPLIMLFQITVIVLIFTDQYTHIMRNSTLLEKIDNVYVLRVNSSIFGSFSVGLNYIIIFYSILKLLIFSKNTSGTLRNQSAVIIIGSLFPFIFGWLKSALPQNLTTVIPISAALAPGCLLILWGIFKYDFMSISPIARNKIFDMVNDGIIVCTSNGRIVDFNISASHIFESVGLRLDNINISDYGRDEFSEWFQNIISLNDSISEFRLNTGNSYYDYESHVFIMKDKKDKVVLGTISIIREITEIKRKNEELKTIAYTDGLTGILNRNAFIEAYNSTIKQNYKNGYGMLLIDLDHFKRINDEYGHVFGDEVLKGTINCIKKIIRENDHIGRIGGEEFAIILSNTSSESAEIIAERIRENVEKNTFINSGKEINITISMGAAHIASEEKPEFKKAFAYVDKLLYFSKNRGRNSVSFQKYKI